MNYVIKHAETRRLVLKAATFYREHVYPLPMEFKFPGLRVVVKIEPEQDTLPLGRAEADEDSLIED